MEKKLFMFRAEAENYINASHPEELKKSTSFTDNNDVEYMDNRIPEWTGYTSGYIVGDEVVGWFAEACDSSEIALRDAVEAQDVRIYGTDDVADAVWAQADILKDGEIFSIPVFYYEEGDKFTFFTPADWQGHQPESPEEAEEYDWVLAGTEKDAIFLNGAPRML